MDCSPPGSSVHGMCQARIPERVAMSFSRGSSRSRDPVPVSCVPCDFTHWVTGDAHKAHSAVLFFKTFPHGFLLHWGSDPDFQAGLRGPPLVSPSVRLACISLWPAGSFLQLPCLCPRPQFPSTLWLFDSYLIISCLVFIYLAVLGPSSGTRSLRFLIRDLSWRCTDSLVAVAGLSCFGVVGS